MRERDVINYLSGLEAKELESIFKQFVEYTENEKLEERISTLEYEIDALENDVEALRDEIDYIRGY